MEIKLQRVYTKTAKENEGHPNGVKLQQKNPAEICAEQSQKGTSTVFRILQFVMNKKDRKLQEKGQPKR